jgi:hypothetical protein
MVARPPTSLNPAERGKAFAFTNRGGSAVGRWQDLAGALDFATRLDLYL